MPVALFAVFSLVRTPTPAPRAREAARRAATARDREPGPAPQSLTHPDPGGLAGEERAGERGDPRCGTPVSLDQRAASTGSNRGDEPHARWSPRAIGCPGRMTPSRLGHEPQVCGVRSVRTIG